MAKKYTVETYHRVVDSDNYGQNRIIAADIYNRTDAELLASRLNAAVEVGTEQGIKAGKAETEEKYKDYMPIPAPENS